MKGKSEFTHTYRAATVRERSGQTGESGYAMLLVFLMAAMIAIMLYREMPRVAFEAQRAKEELLIERGEQYKRAIQLFVRKVNRYPASIDELESLNNTRFLRKRYIDPITGKDKWRLIHINGGVLTDSIIPKNKPGQPGGDQQQQMQQTFIGEGPAMAGAQNDEGQQQNNPALRRRPSDDRPAVTQEAAAPPSGDSDTDDTDNSDSDNNSDETPAPNTGNQPGMAPNPAIPGMPMGRFPQPGMYPPNVYAPGQPGQPGYNPAMGNMPGQPGYNPAMPTMPGQSGYPPMGGMNFGSTPNQGTNQGDSGGFPAPSYIGQGSNTTPTSGVYYPGQTNTPFNGQTGAFPGQPPGMMPGQMQQPGFGGQMGGFGTMPGGVGPPSGGFSPTNFGNNPGLQNPQNLNGGPTLGDLGLGSPRPNGFQGLPGMGGTQIGGGIAGVASESKTPSIIVYNERKKYNEWEFVYDKSKDRGLAGVQSNGGAPGTPVGQMPNGMNPQGGPGGAFPPGGPSAFGQSGFGQSGFGQSGFGQSGFGPSGGQSGFGNSGFGQQPPQQPQQPQQPPN